MRLKSVYLLAVEPGNLAMARANTGRKTVAAMAADMALAQAQLLL